MAKARFALGIICISLVFISIVSVHVESLTTTAATTTTTTTAASPPYPACDTLASYAYAYKPKGQAIDMYGPKNQKFNSKNQTTWADWYRAGDAKTGWSKWPAGDGGGQKGFLDRTLIYLFIDGKPASIKTDICYDKDGKFFKKKVPDSLYKIFYLVIAPGTYAGKHYFCLVGFWNGQYDSKTGTKSVTVTFT